MTALAARVDRVARRIYRSGFEAARNRRMDVRTSDEIELADLDVDGPDGTPYAPSRWSTLKRILPPAEVGRGDVFLELGSGMGGLVLMAASYPFRRVLYVEISLELCRIARTNIEVCRRQLVCRDVEIVESNALDFAIPDDVSIIILYNPFTGQVMSAVVEALIASFDRNPRRMRIIYRNPVAEAVLLATGRVVPVRTIREFQLTVNLERWRSLRMYELRSAHRSSGSKPLVHSVAPGTAPRGGQLGGPSASDDGISSCGMNSPYMTTAASRAPVRSSIRLHSNSNGEEGGRV